MSLDNDKPNDLLSSPGKPLNILIPPPTFIDHLEIKLHHIDVNRVIPASKLRLPSPLSNYLHNDSVSISKHGQVSVGGPYHASTNGKRIYYAHLGDPLRTFNASQRKKDPLHHQLSDLEKTKLKGLAKAEEPWLWQLKEYLGIQLNQIDAYMKNSFNGIILTRLWCPCFEIYREYPVTADQEAATDEMKMIIGSMFGEGREVDRNTAKYPRGRSCYWTVPIPYGGSTREVNIKYYPKGQSMRLEIQAKNFQVNKADEQSLNICCQNLIALGHNLQKILDDIHTKLQTSVPAVDPVLLENTIAHYIKSVGKKRHVKEFIKIVATYGMYNPSTIKDKDLRLSDYELDLLSNPRTGILAHIKANGVAANNAKSSKTNRNAFMLKPNWLQLGQDQKAVPYKVNTNNNGYEIGDAKLDKNSIFDMMIYLDSPCATLIHKKRMFQLDAIRSMHDA